MGTGGLGSPAAMYLTAAGVGTIGLVDFDVVEESNLQRQILHGTSSIGRSKLDSARERLSDLNPNTKIEGFDARITSENAMEILKGFDVVIDGSDNFPTRYLINDACALLGIPDIYGSIFRFEGQVSVFDASRGPCYRCLFRDPPPPGLVPSCAEGGVLGVLPGIIGSIQALEAIKLIMKKGNPLIGRLVMLDTLSFRVREMELSKDPECPVCGENPTVKELIDYDHFCGIDAVSEHTDMEVTVTELAKEIEANPDIVLVDVREAHELRIAMIDGSVHIPLQTIPQRLSDLDPEKEIVTICHTGVRSFHAMSFLRKNGFSKVRSLRGGIDAWSVQVDPSVPRY